MSDSEASFSEPSSSKRSSSKRSSSKYSSSTSAVDKVFEHYADELTVKKIQDLKDECRDTGLVSLLSWIDAKGKPKAPVKAHWQVGWLMMKSGIWKKGNIDKEIYQIVREWSTKGAYELQDELSCLKIEDEQSTRTNRYRRMVALIHHYAKKPVPGLIQSQLKPDFGNKVSVDETSDSIEEEIEIEVVEKELEKGKKTTRAQGNTSAGSKQSNGAMDFEVANLLLAAVFADVAHNDTLERIPKMTGKNTHGEVRNFLRMVDQIKTLESDEHVSLKLSPPCGRQFDIMEIILDTFRNTIEAAHTNNYEIKAFDDSVYQFVVTKPKEQLQNDFKTEFAARKSSSTLALHGTPLCNLWPTLSGGFFKLKDLHVSKEPADAYPYALQVPEDDDEYSQWTNSPYDNYGVLLGCEFAGDVAEGPVPARSAIVRYIFLVSTAGDAPKRAEC